MANFIIIRELCDKKNITIRELSKRVDRKESTVQSLIRNGSTSTQTVEAIADVLGVSPAIFWQEPVNESNIEKENKYLRQLIAEKDARILEKEKMIEFLMAKQ